MHLSKTCRRASFCLVSWCAVVCAPILFAEIPDIDITAEGPWSDIEKTTLTVPLVASGSISVDGEVSQEEYGNFPGQFVNPGDNGRIHNFPNDRQWDDEADSSFTFWLAHDETYFYVGVDAKDDILNNDDPNAALWKDDSIEIVVDALNDRFDNNTDNSMDPFGGHCYIGYNGKFSGWNDADNVKEDTRWSTAVEWSYGEDGEVWAVGKEVDGGWQLDVRFAKTLFEDPDAGNKLENGYVMGFNIGVDDDDKFGPGANGDGSRTQDLELQYFWANRARLVGWNAEAAEDYTPEQIASRAYEADFEETIINQNGRLAHGGSGEIIFSNENPFELAPGPNISVNGKKALGKLSKENPSYAEVVKVRNSGTENALAISGVTVSGANKDLFTVNSFPATLDPQAEGEIQFTFSPNGQTGEFSATLEIASDDVDADDQTRLVEITASVVNLQGPIAQFALDEAVGATEMLDVSGNGRHGTFVGSVTLGDAALATGTALSVSGGGHGRLEGSAFRPDNFTVSLWMNAGSGGGANQTVFAQGSDGNPAYALLAGDGNLQWFVGDQPLFSASAAYTEGAAHHVAVSYMNVAPFPVAIYVDGVEVAAEDLGEALDVPRDAPFTLGSFGPALPYLGVLDDLQIYDRVLSVEDVAFLRDNPGQVLGGGAPVDPGGGNAMITWQTPNSNTTTADLIGGPSITFAPFGYDGGNADDAFFTGDGGTSGDADLDAVYNSHGWNSEGASILLDGLTAGEAYQIQLLGAGDTRSCCATRNQAASDGQGNVSGDFPRGNSSVIGTFTAAGTSQEIMVIAGAENGTDPGLSGFILTDGEGSLISAFNVGREAGETITVTVPEAGPGGLEGYWSFDEGSGTTAADGSGEGRDATFRNGEPTWVGGQRGGGLAFDGDDDLTVTGWKGISGVAPRSVSYWMKTDWISDTASGNVAWGSSETGLKWHIRLNENAGNGPVGAIRTEIQGSFHIGTKVINDDAWHHVVSVFPEGGQFMQDLLHYVDGELQEVGGTGSTTVEVNTAGEAEGGTDVTFGSRLQGAADHYYMGAMDEVSIWNRALSAEEILALSQGATPLNVAAGDLETDGGGGVAPPLASVLRTAGGVAIGVPDGQTYDIQYSPDLENWETIASGTMGTFEDTDAARTGGAVGYYRGVKP